jgi:hypothetical protein
MADTPLSLILLGVMALSLSVMAVAMVVAASAAHRTLRRIETLVPSCDRALQQTSHVLRQAHQLLAQVNTAAHTTGAAIERTCTVVTGIVDRVNHFKEQTEAFFAGHFGNGHGAKAELRRRHHRG